MPDQSSLAGGSNHQGKDISKGVQGVFPFSLATEEKGRAGLKGEGNLDKRFEGGASFWGCLGRNLPPSYYETERSKKHRCSRWLGKGARGQRIGRKLML